jgi:hypothetical protein
MSSSPSTKKKEQAGAMGYAYMPIIPAMEEAEVGGSQTEASPSKSIRKHSEK